MTKRKVDGLLVECCGCRKMLPRGQFRRRTRLCRDGIRRVELRSRCRGCEKPEKAASRAVRRERTVGTYSPEDVRRLSLSQGYACVTCRRDLRVVGYHVDHIVPVSKGGLNVASNIQLLCPRCNLRKGARMTGRMTGRMRHPS